MHLRLHNSLSGRKDVFEPQSTERVTMYVCGPTVYSYAHIGNTRPAVVFDTLFRLLREIYGTQNVVYARNITDIDDKIIQAAQAQNVSIDLITERFTRAYEDNMRALGVLPPTIVPRATDHIGAMQEMVTRLLARGHAYVAQGHVLFDVTSYASYGQLSKISKAHMVAGARVDIAPYKRDPADFVLWKPSTPTEPGWHPPSHWGLDGQGRPGWHLECSAMIETVLLADSDQNSIDIHGGGQDLRFPHHENEIAQSCCAHPMIDVSRPHTPLANYWLHNGFVQMGEDKMSKSSGNIITPQTLLTCWPGDVLRFALLSTHYRQSLDWSQNLLIQSKNQLDRFYRLLEESSDISLSAEDMACPVPSGFLAALADDLNTPAAIAALHELREDFSATSRKTRKNAKASLLRAGALLGLLQTDPTRWFKGVVAQNGLTEQQIAQLLEERTHARNAQDYATSDAIRAKLTAAGVIIEDTKDGKPTWRRA